VKLELALERMPWPETFERLCADPETRVQPQNPWRIIGSQRDTQVDTLARCMFQPTLAYAAREGSMSDFQLQAPRTTARLVLADAIRTGRHLLLYDPNELAELDPVDAGLGLLLRLMATADGLSRTDREALTRDWNFALSLAADPGPVLGLMIDAGGTAERQRLASVLLSRLEETGKKPMEGQSQWVQPPRSLDQWLNQLGREGAVRLTELGAPLGTKKRSG
jgi:hypothetical protein